MLAKMGWKVLEESHRRMQWEDDTDNTKTQPTPTHPKRRSCKIGGPGIGYGRVNTATQAQAPEQAKTDVHDIPELLDLDYLGYVSGTDEDEPVSASVEGTNANTQIKHVRFNINKRKTTHRREGAYHATHAN